MTDSPYPDRLQALRDALRAEKLDGFLVPMADDYQNEYVAPHDKRIKFLTGFTGSAGFVLVLMDKALFFSDGRYMIQAKEQLPPDTYEIFNTQTLLPSEWLEQNLGAGRAIGYDPRLHTARQVERLESVLAKKQGRLVPLETNPLDRLWQDRPARANAPVTLHPLRFAGQSFADKSRALAGELASKKADAAILTDPASIAWLLNVRGRDVPFTPLPLSTALLYADGHVDWFVDPAKLPAQTRDGLDLSIKVHEEGAFPQALDALGAAHKTVCLDPDLTPSIHAARLGKAGANILHTPDLCALPRARKNEVELNGMKAAHDRDAIAVIRLLHWLDTSLEAGETVTELAIEERLTAFRAEGQHYVEPSFATIAGAGPHGAIIHYRAKPQTDRALGRGEFLLLDSGAQYLDGTTDITRTIPFGTVTPEMMDRYTRVLRGHIALARARFPKGTAGAHLDVLARQHLWSEGLDFGHGTGHGVGCYLGVHEGPQTISRRGLIPLEAGMVLSNEPGYYKEGAYGIRLENLHYVKLVSSGSGERTDVFGFEPLTLVPFDTRPLLTGLLSSEDKDWLNAYHADIFERLALRLDEPVRVWLSRATQAI